mmetsp:Transcript_8782/g.17087  ORF Transcript_8782/g.17087 Transcript_8782/m.17087 type:complete len:300 (+) Transcript_8782:96-995(+)
MVKVVHRMPSTHEGAPKEMLQLLKTYEESMAESPNAEETAEEAALKSEDVGVLRNALARVSSERDSLKMRVFVLESELSRVRDECGDLSRRCQELETDKKEASLILEHNYHLSHNVLLRNQLLEQKLLAHARLKGHGAPGEDAAADGEDAPVRSRVEEWVMTHKGVHLEYLHEPWEGSIMSSAWGRDSQGAHINPDDSASQEGAWQRVAVGSHQEPVDQEKFGVRSLEQMLELSKRMCPQGQQRGQRADKVARSPWKTSVDVNPVYHSQMLFGRLMGNMAAKAAASGALEDCLSREAFY